MTLRWSEKGQQLLQSFTLHKVRPSKRQSATAACVEKTVPTLPQLECQVEYLPKK